MDLLNNNVGKRILALLYKNLIEEEEFYKIIVEEEKLISKEERYSWERNRTWFKVQYVTRKDSNSEWKVDHEYEAYIGVFRK